MKLDRKPLPHSTLSPLPFNVQRLSQPDLTPTSRPANECRPVSRRRPEMKSRWQFRCVPSKRATTPHDARVRVQVWTCQESRGSGTVRETFGTGPTLQPDWVDVRIPCVLSRRGGSEEYTVTYVWSPGVVHGLRRTPSVESARLES